MTNSRTENSRCSKFSSEVQQRYAFTPQVFWVYLFYKYISFLFSFGCDNCKNVRVWFNDGDGEQDETKEDTRNDEFTALNAEQGES